MNKVKKTYTKNNHWKSFLKDKLVVVVAKNLRQFTIIDDEEFVNFVHYLNSRYILPGCNTFSSSLLQSKYAVCKYKMMETLFDTKLIISIF